MGKNSGLSVGRYWCTVGTGVPDGPKYLHTNRTSNSGLSGRDTVAFLKKSSAKNFKKGTGKNSGISVCFKLKFER